MDYEKKYKEALKRAKGMYESRDDAELAAYIFPELAESDDERIRKALIDGVRQIRCKNGITQEQMIAYLERQKEPIPIPDKFSGLKSLMLQYFDSAVHRNDDAEIESDTDLFGRKILDYVWKYSDEQKEQKPWKVGANAYFTPEQKPADLSEMMVHKEPYIAPVPTLMVADEQKPAECNKCAMFLSGECTHPNGKCKHVKSAEWSEEDKDMLNSCISSIEEAKENRYAYKETDGDTSYDHEIAWLKSLHPVSKESLQPHWKPSEHQMTILKAVKDYVGVGSGYWGEALASLIEDLEKL